MLCLSTCSGGTVREAAPALWVVRDTDTTIYITGTVHLLPDRLDWNSPALAAAAADADTLVTELSPEQLSAAKQLAPKYFYRERPEPLADRFPPELRAAFAKFESDMPRIPNAARLDDWALGLMMAQSVADDAGLAGSNGMDNGLIAAFAKSGKPRAGLETAADQFTRFDAIPAAEQRRMLDHLMREVAAGRADDQLNQSVNAWATGDMAMLAELIERDQRRAPATHRLLLVERNAKWADWVTERMKQPGTILLAVGAGHLAGKDSLLAMLESRRMVPKRLDRPNILAKPANSS